MHIYLITFKLFDLRKNIFMLKRRQNGHNLSIFGGLTVAFVNIENGAIGTNILPLSPQAKGLSRNW
jgi:hypothetical protein